jgi:hypothetical protein
MSYSVESLPNFVIKECSSGPIDIVDHVDYFELYNNGDTWMVYNKDKDFEIKEMYSSYDLAHGDVLVSGLGFGILALWLCNKPEVKSVTVIEISKDVIKIFKDYNVIPEKLTIINDNMITYDTDKEYDSLLLDHYNKQSLDWRLKDIKRICSRINHKSFWAWSLENIYLSKMYPNTTKDQDSNRYKNLVKSEGDLSILWNEFIDKFLPKEIVLKSLDSYKLNDYLYNYFNKYNQS